MYSFTNKSKKKKEKKKKLQFNFRIYSKELTFCNILKKNYVAFKLSTILARL
jgi:hypothetical protein